MFQIQTLKRCLAKYLVIKKSKYNYYPKTKEELRIIVEQLIINRGNEGNLNDIDTSKITDMSGLFSNLNFNGDISEWNVSKVKDMSYMFYGCKIFNQDISTWNVSKVTDMYAMFCGCKTFNQDISNWNVCKVKDSTNIFFKCPIEEKYKPRFK